MEQERTDVIETHPEGTAREVREVREPAPGVTEVRNSSTTVPRQEVDNVDMMSYDPYEPRRVAAYRLTQLVYWVFGLVEGLIAIRLILKALGANQAAGFAEFIYSITAALVAPFINLFSNPSYGGSVLELSSIVALIVYALIAWLLGKLIWILVGETRSAVRTRSHQIDSRIN